MKQSLHRVLPDSSSNSTRHGNVMNNKIAPTTQNTEQGTGRGAILEPGLTGHDGTRGNKTKSFSV